MSRSVVKRECASRDCDACNKDSAQRVARMERLLDNMLHAHERLNLAIVYPRIDMSGKQQEIMFWWTGYRRAIFEMVR